MSINLMDLFKSLDTPLITEKDSFSAIPIIGYEAHRLGKNSQGLPLLLISTTNFASQSWPAPIVLEHLTVQHNLDCRITHPNGQIETGKYTLIQCTSHDLLLHIYFLRIMGILLIYLGDTPTEQEITETVDKLVDLFRPLTKPPKKSIQGLWAELYLIARLKKPAILVQAWHKNPKDYFDFYQDNQRIEVKSSASQKRVHHFSLEQLNPPEGIKAIVASLFVEHSQSGQSLANLIKRINSRLNEKPDLMLRLEKIVSLTLGNNWRSASEEYFDVKLAEQSLAFFDVSNVPSVNPNLPIGVTNVKFQSDLTGSPTIDRSQYQINSIFFDVMK